MKRRNGKKGFTLIELMIVISIIAILIAIALPIFLRVKNLVQKNATKGELRSIQSALELYYTDKELYPETIKVLVDDKYLPEAAEKDAWSNEYNYEQVDEGKNYKLASPGPDGTKGNEDDVEAPEKGHSFAAESS